ncbi:conserved hypothetical protein [Desulfosarcina cetonica]|nr:conserved hypothetical protein [Desulfosarcina cetonica]
MNLFSMLKSFYRRSFFQFILFSLLLSAVVTCFLWRFQELGLPLRMNDYLFAAIFIIGFGLLQWLFLKNSLSRLSTKLDESKGKKTPAPTSPDRQALESDRIKRKNQEKRLFVHLFAVLQREGRLMDFLQEDLNLYEDAQIGAAVRSIHENCRKTVERYLKPVPVITQAEGETVKIDAGFDPHAIKLVGNVVGEPPFSGILRHRGWQLQSLSIPDLSEMENPTIIAPAEVEVQ